MQSYIFYPSHYFCLFFSHTGYNQIFEFDFQRANKLAKRKNHLVYTEKHHPISFDSQLREESVYEVVLSRLLHPIHLSVVQSNRHKVKIKS
jgi:hypothetical protein